MNQFFTPKDLTLDDFKTEWLDLDNLKEVSNMQMDYHLRMKALTMATITDLKKGDSVQNDDLVALKMESSHPEFNQELIPCRLGSGELSTTAEQKIIDECKVGESITADFTPSTGNKESDVEASSVPVKMTLLHARRLTPHPYNDELAAKLGEIEKIEPKNYQTWAIYEKYLYRELLVEHLENQFIHNGLPELVQKLFEQSGLKLKESDIQGSRLELNKLLEHYIASNTSIKPSDEGKDLELYGRILGYKFTDERELNKFLDTLATNRVREFIYQEKLGEHEQIEITPELRDKHNQLLSHEKPTLLQKLPADEKEDLIRTSIYREHFLKEMISKFEEFLDKLIKDGQLDLDQLVAERKILAD